MFNYAHLAKVFAGINISWIKFVRNINNFNLITIIVPNWTMLINSYWFVC